MIDEMFVKDLFHKQGRPEGSSVRWVNSFKQLSHRCEIVN
jgi:hypothetical protein